MSGSPRKGPIIAYVVLLAGTIAIGLPLDRGKEELRVRHEAGAGLIRTPAGEN